LVPVRVLARVRGLVACLGEAVTLTHGRTRKRHGEAVALILFIVIGALAFWALAIALAVLIINVTL
jgi:hypothetical protein